MKPEKKNTKAVVEVAPVATVEVLPPKPKTKDELFRAYSPYREFCLKWEKSLTENPPKQGDDREKRRKAFLALVLVEGHGGCLPVMVKEVVDNLTATKLTEDLLSSCKSDIKSLASCGLLERERLLPTVEKEGICNPLMSQLAKQVEEECPSVFESPTWKFLKETGCNVSALRSSWEPKVGLFVKPDGKVWTCKVRIKGEAKASKPETEGLSLD